MRSCWFAFVAILGLALSPDVQAQISVSIPDITDVEPGTSIEVPINVETEIEGDVISYEFGVAYDPNVLEISDVETNGTLSEGLTPTVNSSPGAIYVPAAGTGPISNGPGPLIYLEVQVLEEATGHSPLYFAALDEEQYAFRFNESTPPAIATSGNVSIDTSPPATDLVINEVHPDPAAGNAGDANNDGTRSADDDEFVEIVNAGSSSIDLGGYSIFESDNANARFTFPSGTILDPGMAAVVFGGGTPTDISGLVFTTGTLSLNNDGDTVILKDNGDNVVTAVTYVGNSGAYADQSITRSPDTEGPFVLHTEASPTEALYSPGRTVNDGALPVELSFFDAVRDGRDVVLQWSTASETNNSGFKVQQRSRGTFREIAFVEGAGTTTRTTDYDYRVANLSPGTYTFRLLQVDVNGTMTPSHEVEVIIEPNDLFVLETAYPNPFRTRAAFTLQVQQTQEVTVILFNALGQRVQNVFDGTVRAGTPKTFIIDGTELPSGVYLYHIEGRTFSASKQIARIK